jgi:hypothetical protein
MLDDPSPFDPLETWEDFLAEVRAMPAFYGQEHHIENAKQMIAIIKRDLAAKCHGVRWLN